MHQRNTILVRALPLATTNHDEILNFDNLRENLTKKLNLDNWLVVTTHQNLYIFNLNKKYNGNLSIRNTISIDVDLVVKVFVESNDDDTLFNLKLYRWPQLQTLIEQLSNDVKCEDDLHFECVVEKEQKSPVINGDDDVASFEFCTTTDVRI